MAARTLWIGTYPPAGIGTPPGRGEGVHRVALRADGSLGEPEPVAVAPAPSYLVPHPGGAVLYATAEDEPGAVAAFAVRGGALDPLGAAPSGGALPCHLLVDGGLLYVANYGDGALGVLPLAPDGRFAADEPPRVLRGAGSGPVAGRQEGPHAHFAAVAPGGHLLVVDLGADEVRRYRRTPDGPVADGVAARLPAGTGPRHLVFAADGQHAYVTGELSATVHVLSWDRAAGAGVVVQTLPATGAAGDEPAPSHLALAGGDLVVAVRGPGVLSRFAVGADGLLTHRADQRLPRPVPRHFAAVGPWLVVAEQVPGAVTVLDRDGRVVSSRAVPSAACVALGAPGEPA